ncbi:MAG: metallophosphoesterase family protein [Bacteroidetes bacterium]|nr:metallophosphoesterase family protein [Bacteroidota bacterium]
MKARIYPILAVFVTCLSLTAEAQALTRGPYLQMGNQTAITICWRTDTKARAKVDVGVVKGTYTISVSDNNPSFDHFIRITGLNPDTKYYYRVGTSTTVLKEDSSCFFTTAPPDTVLRKIRIAVFGDCGRDDNNYQSGSLASYVKYLRSNNIKASDLMLLLGDNAYEKGLDNEYGTNFFDVYQDTLLKNHILFPAPGNHDYANEPDRQVDHNIDYFTMFKTPDSAQCGGVASYNKAYYSFNWGNIHFISLDSYGLEDAGTTRLYDTTGAQVQWIKQDLAANTKQWVIAYWHHPPYTMGSHSSDNESELVSIRQNFIRILERYGVDMVLCGHSHDYERSMLMKDSYGNEASFNKTLHCADSSSGKYDGSANSCPYIYKTGKYSHGTVYVVAGSAGASGTVQAGYPHDALPFAYNDGGMFYFEVDGNRLDAKWLRKDSTIADKFTIIKDAGIRDTVTIYKGASVELKANWPGNYVWSTTATSKNITVTPDTTTTFTVKDAATNTCITEAHYVKVIDTLAGVNSFSGREINALLYPVPARDVLHFELQNATGSNMTFTIYNEQGSKLRSFNRTVDKGKQDISIDLTSLPKGQILLLKASDGRDVVTYRFIRQ